MKKKTRVVILVFDDEKITFLKVIFSSV